jgi:hypothetical protein
VGIKEDISDVITNISPRKTPFLSAIGNEKITQPLFQWQEDSLRAVNGTGSAQVEGADATFITVNPTVMRSNYSQIFLEAVQVSGTTEVTLAHGRSKEMAYQMAKSAAQLKRDVENALVGTAQVSAAGSSSTARNMASYQAQITGSGTSTFAAQSGNVFFMNTGVNLSETVLVNALQAVFVAGAEPSRILVTPANSVIVAGFASAAGRYRTIPTEIKGANGTLVNAVNLYVSPFGEQKVEIDRFLKANSTLIYEPDMWSLATLRPWSREVLAKTGDSLKNMIVGEFSLKHKNFLASAIVVDNKAGPGF